MAHGEADSDAGAASLLGTGLLRVKQKLHRRLELVGADATQDLGEHGLACGSEGAVDDSPADFLAEDIPGQLSPVGV